jgi:hypothetical protein
MSRASMPFLAAKSRAAARGAIHAVRQGVKALAKHPKNRSAGHSALARGGPRHIYTSAVFGARIGAERIGPMTSYRYSSSKPKATKRTAVKKAVSRTTKVVEKVAAHAAKPATARTTKAATRREAAANELRRGEAKHRRAAEMVRELRSGAEALSANADRLLRRLA